MWSTCEIFEIKQWWRICGKTIWRLHVLIWYLLIEIFTSHTSTIGVAERKNQTLVKIARCFIQAKGILTWFWEKVVCYSNYLLNLVLTKFVCDMTSVKKWSGRKLSVKHLKMCGCIGWVHISDDYRKKLDAKNHACIMMGYYKESKAYRLFDTIKQYIILGRDVTFYENTLSSKLLNSSSSLMNNDPFEILIETRSTEYHIGALIRQMSHLPTLNYSWSLIAKSIISFSTAKWSFGQFANIGTSSLQSNCLPHWDTKTIEDDVGDINDSRKTTSKKKHGSVDLMTHILESCDPNTYVDVHGRDEWDNSMVED